MSKMKVYNECCNQCLISPNRIVSGERAKEIIQGCVRRQTHFFCHKATIEGEEILCKNFYDKFGHFSQMVRISERLGMIEFVQQPFPLVSKEPAVQECDATMLNSNSEPPAHETTTI